MELFAQTATYRAIVAGLRGLGYLGPLLAEDYAFTDWFSNKSPERRVAAAAFGQTPVSYDSALIGVTQSNGLRDVKLIDSYRALGAPIFLEIDRDEVREWAVSRKVGGHELLSRHSVDRIGDLFVSRAAAWKPESLFRAKNIGEFHWSEQLKLFAGLVPELEERIQESLDPLLRDTLWTTKSAYIDSAGRDPDPTQLFKLVFWLLTAKVFHDRGVKGFENLAAHNSGDLLAAVAKQYRLDEVPRLLNRSARDAAASRIWRGLDFRNLSVEVLSQIWARTLVDDETKRRLGIHRTSRTIVRYMVERVPFSYSGDDKRIVFEPCCGSGVFLIGAMNVLRHSLFGMPPQERHNYFIKHLAGIDKESFSVEISRLALTLADFPNPGGWEINPGDVFDKDVIATYVRRAGVVLCNPPFETFEEYEREDYSLMSLHKPAELLLRILDDLHPSGVLGFVLPRGAMTHRGYAEVRKRLATRFAKIEFTILPDRAFDRADPEVVLMIATDPIPHYNCRVSNRIVDDDVNAWQRFAYTHAISNEIAADISIEDAEKSLQIPELPNVWKHLVNFQSLKEVAEVHRGIEWNKPLTEDGEETGNREKLIRWTPSPGFRKGVAPRTKFHVFEQPAMLYLSLRPEDKRTNAYLLAWEKPKVIANKSTRSRGGWRLSAFPDSEGVTCYQTYFGIWPKSNDYDEWILSAVLNSPVANAFVSTREGKIDITKEILEQVPIPILSLAQITSLRELIQKYQRLTKQEGFMTAINANAAEAERVLKLIDAAVLDGYHLPPRVEQELLEFFRGDERPTPFPFSAYLPEGEDVYFSLSERLSPRFKESTAGSLLKRMAIG